MTEHDLEKELDGADDRALELVRAGDQLGAFRLAKEVAARAKGAGLLFPYLGAQFRLMNTARSLFDATAAKDACLAALALLESPEAAAAFQPGHSEREYGWYQHWLSPCSYDNLAEATALSDGYNSSGLHRCVADGIEVCHRVGKTECVTCFREYASKVCRASDDLEMALFHTRRNMHATPKDEDSDRRYVGALKTHDIELLLGRAGAASIALAAAVMHAPRYHAQRTTRHQLALAARQLRALIGAGAVALPPAKLEVDLDALVADAPEALDALANPEEAYERALVDALELALAGDPAAAEALLRPWDERFRSPSLLDPWFEVRLRRVALADGVEGERLATELETLAHAAADHLTLRRLRASRQLVGGARLLAALGPLTWGPVTTNAPERVAPRPSDEPSSDAGSDVPKEAPAFAVRIRAFVEELEAAPEGSERDVLSWIEAEEARCDRAPAPDLLLAMNRSMRIGAMDEARASATWDWARRAAASVPDDGVALSRAAEIGAFLIDRAEPFLADRLSSEAVERLFERAMHLAPDEPEAHGRAGLYFVRHGEPERAERPLARAARLDRHVASVVIALAGIYEVSGRGGDALELIDLSVRSGCDDTELLWEGAMLAPILRRNQLGLAYLDRFVELRPDAPWAHYYRAKALLSLGRYDEVAEAITLERERTDENAFGLWALEAEAAKGLGEHARLMDALLHVLKTPLHAIEGLNRHGIMSTLARALGAAEGTDMASPLRARTLGAGLIPNEALRADRMARAEVEGLDFFEVTLRQPLDPEVWLTYPARLDEQADWTEYFVTYGVLAMDEVEARSMALQLHLAPPGHAAEVVRVTASGESYTDRPGVTSQSFFGRVGEP